MILGFGVDAVDTSKFQYYVDVIPDFLARIFSPRELKLTVTQLAGNFSVREALFKAYPSIKSTSTTSIEVLRNADGKPYLVFQNFRDEQLRGLVIHISITNINTLIISNVLVECCHYCMDEDR